MKNKCVFKDFSRVEFRAFTFEYESLCIQGDMSRSVRGKVTLVEILLLKAKSCLKRLRWTHRVSGRWVTREYFRPLRSFLPEKNFKISFNARLMTEEPSQFSQLYMLSPLSSSAEKK